MKIFQYIEPSGPATTLFIRSLTKSETECTFHLVAKKCLSQSHMSLQNRTKIHSIVCAPVLLLFEFQFLCFWQLVSGKHKKQILTPKFYHDDPLIPNRIYEIRKSLHTRSKFVKIGHVLILAVNSFYIACKELQDSFKAF